MSKRIVVDPFNNNMGWFKHSIALNPVQELWINVQMLIGLTQHHDASSGRTARYRSINNVAE